MRKIWFLFMLMGLAMCALSGCGGSDDSGVKTPTDSMKPKDCEKYGFAWINITNNSKNPYTIYISTERVGVLYGNSSETYNIYKGNNKSLKAVQVSGYVLYPTEVLKSINVISCSNYSWSIP